MSKIHILTRKNEIQTSEGDGEQYGSRGDSSTDWTFLGFEIADKYVDLTTAFEIEPKETYYLLAVVYSTEI